MPSWGLFWDYPYILADSVLHRLKLLPHFCPELFYRYAMSRIMLKATIMHLWQQFMTRKPSITQDGNNGQAPRFLSIQHAIVAIPSQTLMPIAPCFCHTNDPLLSIGMNQRIRQFSQLKTVCVRPNLINPNVLIAMGICCCFAGHVWTVGQSRSRLAWWGLMLTSPECHGYCTY